MAGSISDEWMYNEVLDDADDLAGNAFTSDLTRRTSVDSTDLLDDVLTLPSALPTKQEATEEDAEMSYVQEPENGSLEVESGSARYNAEQMVKIVEARITSNKTSQSATPSTLVGGVALTAYSREPNRKNSIFVGNMTWWTTDVEVINAIRNAGLGEVKIIKFIENRTNGQSKGMAMVELANEALALGAPDKLHDLVLHDKKIVTAYGGRLNIPQFEAKCQGKPMPGKVSIPNKAPRPPLMPSVRPPMPGLPPGLPPTIRPPGFPEVPPYPPMLPNNTLFNSMRPPPPLPTDITKPTPHLNPAFLQDISQGGNVAELFAKAAAQFQNRTNVTGSLHKTPPISEAEESDANQRNRAISSSAITRAMSDANEGDYESAVDTLKMAITLIKQSITATSESSQMLLQSLQDCLQGIERQASDIKRARSRDRSHESRDARRHRSNGRGTESSSKHHRNRSRERRR